jgi:DNA-binding response OmpR family regulator
MPKLIFVADDERCIADTLALILSNTGHKALAFYDAKSLLEQAKSCPPELVISDVVMPGMNGCELAVAIRTCYPECKILLLSGQADTMDLLEGVRLRGFDFELLAKPIHPTDLLARIER